MVGGEEASNEEVRERHQLKIKHVEERKRKLQGTSPHVTFWCRYFIAHTHNSVIIFNC